ncbi:MAG: cytochrome c biogenesis protein CcsA [Verrucomicrobiaceae bacterium]|nr:cytochrome c biogenesis protein CcsA [Verrucomicrobiaceae bacterium]
MANYERWDAQIVELFGSLPVLEEGRLKPIETVARYKLLRMNSSKSLRLPVGGEKLKISATEWMLDCLFRPELAKKIPVFKVNNPDVLINLGLEPHHSPRERYSYEEFSSVVDPEGMPKVLRRLSELTNAYSKVLDDPEREQEAKQLRRDPVKAGTLSLKTNMNEFEWLVNTLNFARDGLGVDLGEISPEFVKTGTGKTSVSYFLEVFDKVREVARLPDGGEAFVAKLNTVFSILERDTMTAGIKDNSSMTSLAMFPPISRDDEEWVKPGYIIEQLTFKVDELSDIDKALFTRWAMPKIKALERLAGAVDSETEKVNSQIFLSELDSLHKNIVSEAEARSEYSKVKLEMFNNRAGLFHWALGFYFLAFLLIAFTWLAPASAFARFASLGVWAMTGVATIALIAGIILRSVMLGRPPISTLYETIPFITASAVLLCLFIEVFDRKKIALAVATLLGVGGMFLAMRFELKEARDTLKVLEAVLRSNFWLATHVIAINIGYAAALLAGAIGHIYIFAALFGVKNRDFLKAVTRMVYGVSCFGLVFALVGTVLGGVWANDSWGRFWGWDPKENGALMICIGILVMLHARMGGLIKDLGISMFAVFVSIITVFSWWHVNQLETGLHSYGFTDGIMFWLYLTYGIEFSVIALGVIAHFGIFPKLFGGREPRSE